MKGFGSDNHSGVHPEILQAILKCNEGHAPSYGTDIYSEKSILEFKKLFGRQTQVFFVFNGTAANVLALRLIMNRHQSVLCTTVSHLNVDECGAPEFFAGKLIPLEATNGKLNLATLKKAFIRRGDQHFSQQQVVSLTQPTELGTCYSLQEIKEITEWAHSQNMYVHIDGSRLSNALIHLETTFQKMTTDLGVDIVSFGGTKNGLLMGEAILVLNPKLPQDLKFIRKQSAQLPSKTRFIAAQFQAYLENETYLKISQHSCRMAKMLYEKLSGVPQIKLSHQPESNAVFACIPKDWIKILRENNFFYIWNEESFECRLMTTWDTQESEIENFAALAKKLSRAEIENSVKKV